MFKKQEDKQYITKLIIIIPIFFIIVTILSSMYIAINLLNSHFDEDVNLRAQYELDLQKQTVKAKIESVVDYIEQKQSETKKRLKQRLKDRVYMGYDLINQIYEQNQGKLSEQAIKKEILKTLRKVRYGDDGYLFVVHIKSDKELYTRLAPSAPQIENVNGYGFKDANGELFIKKIADAVVHSPNNEAYVDYSWFKLTEKRQASKISFAKLFKPYNWYIGYGEYYEDFEQQIKDEAIKRLNTIRYGEDGYVWAHNLNHILIQHPFQKKDIGLSRFDLTDKKGNKFVQKFIAGALKNPEGAYVEYFWNRPNEKQVSKKVAFVRHIPNWDWVVGTGFYVDNVTQTALKFKDKKEHEVSHIIGNLLGVSFVILIAAVLMSLLVSKNLTRRFYKYEKFINRQKDELKQVNDSLEIKVNEKTKELQYLNEELEHKIEQRLLEIKQKDAQLIEQSKMVALGEMIGHIAHQWRQPLSAISTAAGAIRLKHELGTLEDQEIKEFTTGITDNSKYLSQVIDDFKNYIKGEKVSEEFNINEAVYKSISIVDSSIHNHHLKLVRNYADDVVVINYINELVQVVVNILNNSKDAFLEHKIDEDERFIFIDTYKTKEHGVICIKDSAGGIPNEILPKIFEPYFTTKGESQGTGLGLYMSYQLVVKSMKGRIKVENIDYNYEGKNYSGVQFEILIPFQ